MLEHAGYRALTYESIGREAELSPNLIRYHFGNKAGLLVALTDWLMYDTLWDVSRRLSGAPEGTDRLGLVVQAFVGTYSDPESYKLFYDLLPHMLRDERMKQQLADLYQAYVSQMVSVLAPEDGEPETREQLRVLGALTIAASDGLAVQLLASPGSVDAKAAAAQWRDYLEWTLAKLTHRRPDGNAAAEFADTTQE